MYFRTEENAYGIDIIVATETDATLVSSSGNVWIESSDPDCVPGNYWHNNTIYVPGSDEYNNDIAPLISAARADADAAIADAEQAERDRIAEEQAAMSTDLEGDPVEGTELTLEERKVLAKRYPSPTYIPIREDPLGVPDITAENLAIWEERLADTGRLIAGVEGDTDPDPQIVRFPEPITFLEGTDMEHTIEYVILPDEEKADYIAHLRIVEADQASWVAHMKSVLGV